MPQLLLDAFTAMVRERALFPGPLQNGALHVYKCRVFRFIPYIRLTGIRLVYVLSVALCQSQTEAVRAAAVCLLLIESQCRDQHTRVGAPTPILFST